MHRILVVVFDDEIKAHEGENVLLRLDRSGSIIVCDHAILAKNAAGTVNLLPKQDFGPLDTLLGTPLASLIALLGGPEGLAPSAATGFTFGRGADTYNARLGGDFVDDVRNAFLPGKIAIVSEIEEDWTAAVDAHMEHLAGIVLRRSLSNVRRTVDEDNLAAMQADVEQLKDEQSLSDSDRKEQLERNINQLCSKINAEVQKAEERRGMTSASEGSRKELAPSGTRVEIAPRVGASNQT